MTRAPAIVMLAWLAIAGQLSLPSPTAPVNVRVITGGPTVGPTPSITCPSSAVRISPGASIQAAVTANPGGTTFCITAGSYQLSASITPKSGDAFIGEYGAILDATGWQTNDDSAGIIRAWNCGIPCANVTIKNLVLRNHVVNCIAVAGSNGWIIDHNEIAGCSWGLNMHGTLAARLTAQITNNAIHDHSLGAYGIEYAGALLFESNEVSRGGPVQKFATSNGVTVRGNWFHHNQQQGSWFDGDATGCLVENNTSDDNGGSGFMHEVSGQCVYRNNTARRNGESCFFISTSRDLAIYNNTCEDNFRGINTFISCGAIAEPPYAGMIDRDLRDNAIHDNTVRVSATPTSSFASLFSVSGSCAKATAAANNQSNNVFARNTYIVPTAAGSWWYWIAGKTWSQWQAMGQDATGTVQ